MTSPADDRPPSDDLTAKPIWKRWWFVAVIVLIVIFVIAYIFTAPDDDAGDVTSMMLATVPLA
jgi:uncharacterized protein involved in exopolysaccharide biosynthesis